MPLAKFGWWIIAILATSHKIERKNTSLVIDNSWNIVITVNTSFVLKPEYPNNGLCIIVLWDITLTTQDIQQKKFIFEFIVVKCFTYTTRCQQNKHNIDLNLGSIKPNPCSLKHSQLFPSSADVTCHNICPEVNWVSHK